MGRYRTPPSAARLERLAAELEEDGVGFVIGDHRRATVLDELDYALRPPVHERRVPSYGAIIGPETTADAWAPATHLRAERLVTVDFGDAEIRCFADGISSWAIRETGGVDELVVFDRSASSERDLVILASASGGIVVQRHPGGVVRIVGDDGVARRDLTGWHHEPPLGPWLDRIPGCREAGQLTTLGLLLDFAVHDLGARGIGSLLIVNDTGELANGHEHRLPIPPPLSIHHPHDLAPLRHALTQTDGASVFDRDGVLRRMGVRLVPSIEAEAQVQAIGGTRHTSARRYSFDEPDALVVVISEDGPVTVLQAGEAVGRTPA
ncbi:MAG: diadenylate cyclase [Acidimicrobiales bacterium]|nr:diadenylate cyclase [Acidimicrobiales bacterium]